MENWRELDINVDSLWIFPERERGGKHANVYHGNFIPQIPRQLLTRYTREEELVLEFFTGSGTTLYECESLKRDYIGFDINPEILQYVSDRMKGSEARYILNNCDVVDAECESLLKKSLEAMGRSSVDFFIAHPPYLDIVKFTDQAKDLSQESNVDAFLEKLMQAFDNGLKYLRPKGYFAVVMGDVYKKSEVLPLGFYVMNAVKSRFDVALKGVVVKNIEGNRGKLGAQNIWRYRALRSDYFLFKHEYIFVFKKL